MKKRPQICLLMIGDGRDEIHERAHASLQKHLPRFDEVVIVDDREHKLGFAGAIAEGWRQVRDTGMDLVFHFEADFVFTQDIALDRMVAVLLEEPKLAQIALKRQPWTDAERAAGGVVEAHPDDFAQRMDGGDIWTEHRRFFTTNPSLYPAALCAQGWPQESESEGRFTHRLLEDPKVRFAYWGAKFDPPLVEHIGAQRAGHGY